MPFSFDVKLPPDFKNRLPQLQTAAKANNFYLEKYEDGYFFRGWGVEGILKLKSDTANITVTHKPFFISEEMIKKAIADYLHRAQ